MKQTLTGHTAAGTVQAVCSKSFLHRALLCAALCAEQTTVLCGSTGEDVLATVDCLRSLGAQLDRTANGFSVRGGLHRQHAVLPCRQSASTLRFLLPVTAALGICAEFVCDAQLRSRPLAPLVEALCQHGCRISEAASGLRCEGQLLAGTYCLPGGISSQFLSGLLFALPLLVDDSKIMLTEKLCSAPYVQLTAAIQGQFGVTADALRLCKPRTGGFGCTVRGGQVYRSPRTIRAEGDWSNAAPFLCAGALSNEGVTVTGLSLSSVQGDRAILDLLRQFGAAVTASDGAVTVCRRAMHGLCVDAADIPDLVPLLALLGACASGETVITGAGRLRSKETDRLQTTAQTLSALGAAITVTADGLTVRGGTPLSGGTVSSCNDHRIAMLAAVAALACQAPVTVEQAEAVSKSYPHFFEDFQQICR